MWLSKNISKLGLLVSFLSAIGYELTGANSLKFISLGTSMFALTLLIDHVTEAKYFSKTKDLLHYIRFLK